MKTPEQIIATVNGCGVLVIYNETGMAGNITCPGHGKWYFVASWVNGWDHVSISDIGNKHIPPWEVMSFAKDVFWPDHETVMQLHVPESNHINIRNTCLHLWRPQNQEIPTPPLFMV